MSLRDEETPPVIVFVLTEKMREGATGDNFLCRRDFICQPGMTIFSSTSPIQYLLKSGVFPPQSLCVL